MTTSDVDTGKVPKPEVSAAGQQELSANMRFVPFVEGEPASAESSVPAAKKPLIIPLAIILLGLVAAAGVALLVTKKPKAAPTFQDLGAGISNSTGLKGSLQVRWQDVAQYQIKVEPIDPLQSAGFSYVAADPPSALSAHIRILDATGFALCGKEILFHYNSADEHGKDVFQATAGEDGKVMAVNAQGVLPCSQDQFRQASYWDFTTDFPTLAEQDALLKQTANQRARKEAEERSAQHRRSLRESSTFTAEGDDRVSGYDSSRNVLEARLGRNFLVTRANDRNIANAWASSGSLFHYKCDQRSHCSLTHAGGGETIYVLALQ